MNVRDFGSWLGSNDRPVGVEVTTVVLHANAGGSVKSSFAWLKALLANKNSKDDASYHAAIDRDGTVYKLVPFSKRAWHAGRCEYAMPGGTLDLNDYSLGFCWANKNDDHEKVTAVQVAQMVLLIREAQKQFPKLKYLTTHAGVTNRKSDPLGIPHTTLLRIAERTGLTYVRGLRP